MFHHHRSVSSCGDHGDPGKAEKRKGSTANALQFPFLRRHDPDQVQGSGSSPSQHRQVLPSEETVLLGGFWSNVNFES